MKAALKIFSILASRLDKGKKICRVCGEPFDVSAAEWAYNNYWNDHHEDYNYGLEFPDMDICDECAIEETEDAYE